ncbi:unnamed protein product [Closterium sp. NIES-53]
MANTVLLLTFSPLSLLPSSPPPLLTPPPQVQAGCELLRVRWECKRAHTRQRAVATMERLIQSVSHQEKRIRQQQSQAASGSSGGAVAAALPEEEAREAAERMKYCFAVWFPTTPALFKEYGELLVASGCVGEAMRVFETNELWDHLIDCYSLLGKRAAAAALVTTRLKEQKEDPRLWCCLGDLTEEKECYEKAWEFSRHRYARAQRALARMAMNTKDFKEAMAHWEAALAISPLHASAWFSLGYSAIQACDGDKALYALTRSVQIDPDNGEAWNNLAVL